MNKNTENNSVEDSHVEEREAQTELTTPTGSEFPFSLKDLAQNIRLTKKLNGMKWEIEVKSGAGSKMLDKMKLFGDGCQNICAGEQLKYHATH
jgi:hypothetical protein